MKLITTILFSLFFGVNCKQFDYYWKDYHGEIPDDAIPGGLDRSSRPTYIAQVYLPDHGILTTRLYPGDKSVQVSRNGVHTSDVFIKILCSDKPEKLSWISTTSTKVHIDLIGRHLVVGGVENGKILNIGRLAYQGEVIVGKVCTYNVGDAKLYFPFKDEEIRVDSYEVLVYDEDIPSNVLSQK